MYFLLFLSILAMPLPQTNCNQKKKKISSYFGNAIATNSFPQVFFFPQFRQWHCQKPTRINFFSLLFRQCHCHNFIPLFLVIEERDKPNCFSKKKNTERIRICVLFFISLLYFGNIIAINNKFFFLLCTFFCFCSEHFRIRIFCLCSEYLFFAICLHHFRIRILYLSL